MKKGISPIIASVLLIAIAVGITAAIGPSIISFIKSQAEETTSKSEAEIKCSKAGIYVRKAICNTTSNTTKFRVENTGYQELKDFRVDLIYDNGTSASYTFYGSEEILPAGSSRWFINESVHSYNFKELVILSGTCPSTARSVLPNSSISFVS